MTEEAPGVAGRRAHRIAAGAVDIRAGRILLVRYRQGYLVCPGGAIEPDESLTEAAARECREETGIVIRLGRLVAIELLAATRYTMQKSWFLGDPIGGAIVHGPDAIAEGIVQIGWFADDDLRHETVFPELVKEYGPNGIRALADSPLVLPLRSASF